MLSLKQRMQVRLQASRQVRLVADALQEVFVVGNRQWIQVYGVQDCREQWRTGGHRRRANGAGEVAWTVKRQPRAELDASRRDFVQCQRPDRLRGCVEQTLGRSRSLW